MTANPLPKTDEFDLSTAQVLYPFGAPLDPATAEPVAYEPPPGVLLPGERKPKAKPGRKPGSKNKPRKARAPVTESVTTVTEIAKPAPVVTAALNAAGTDGRRRFTVPIRVWFIGAIIASLAIGAGLALVIR